MREKITSAVFIAILAAFFVLVMLFPKDERASVQENRPLAEMPKASLNNIFFGSFTTDYEEFLTDNVGLRSRFVSLGSFLENIRGIKSAEKGTIIERAGGTKLVLNDGKIMEVFEKNEDAEKQYAAILNEYAAKLDANMYLMLVPTQIEFDTSEYRLLSDSEKSAIDAIYGDLSGLTGVNVYDKLKANTSDYIYFRTDHHWTQRGAYLGYEALTEATGEKAAKLQDLKHNKQSGFLGYLYNQANVPEYSKYADDIEYFEGEENYEIKAKGPDENGKIIEYSSRIYCPSDGNAAPLYSTFMGGDHAFAEITTNVKNGKTLLVIKDSYANAVIPLLTNNYSKIVVIDPRSYFGTLSDLTDEYSFDECFVINYVFTSTATDYINNLIRIK